MLSDNTARQEQQILKLEDNNPKASKKAKPRKKKKPQTSKQNRPTILTKKKKYLSVAKQKSPKPIRTNSDKTKYLKEQLRYWLYI